MLSPFAFLSVSDRTLESYTYAVVLDVSDAFASNLPFTVVSALSLFPAPSPECQESAQEIVALRAWFWMAAVGTGVRLPHPKLCQGRAEHHQPL